MMRRECESVMSVGSFLLPQSVRRHEGLKPLDAGRDCGNNHASGEAPHFKKM